MMQHGSAQREHSSLRHKAIHHLGTFRRRTRNTSAVVDNAQITVGFAQLPKQSGYVATGACACSGPKVTNSAR